MNVGLYAVPIETSQPIKGGRDVKFNILALVQYLENFVRATPDNINFPLMAIFRYQHPPSFTHRVGPFAGPHASGVDFPRQALHAQNRRYVPLVACNHSRSMANVHKKSFGENPMENGVFVLHLSQTGIDEGYWMSGCYTESRRTVGPHPTRCYQRCHVYAGAGGSTGCCALPGHCLVDGWLPFEV